MSLDLKSAPEPMPAWHRRALWLLLLLIRGFDAVAAMVWRRFTLRAVLLLVAMATGLWLMLYLLPYHPHGPPYYEPTPPLVGR